MSASPKSQLSDIDICDRFITPALMQAGWTREQHILREYTLRFGRVVLRGQASHRDKASMQRADYVLFTSPTCPWQWWKPKTPNTPSAQASECVVSGMSVWLPSSSF